MLGFCISQSIGFGTSTSIQFFYAYFFKIQFGDKLQGMAKLKWSDPATQTLLKTLYEQALEGEKAENGFKKKAWTAARAALKETHGLELEASQLKSKWANVS